MKNRIEKQKNQLLQHGDQIIRVLNMEDDRVFIIDCIKKTMPVWTDAGSLKEYVPCSEDTLQEITDTFLVDFESLDAESRKTAYERYTMIAPLLPFISDQKKRKELYCDSLGNLLSEYPSFYQFRYFYRKTKKMQTYYISRDGLKNYQKNNRALLGDGIQEYASSVGMGMLDATVCDIYLVNEAGNLVGRPILTACIDAYSSLCCGFPYHGKVVCIHLED